MPLSNILQLVSNLSDVSLTKYMDKSAKRLLKTGSILIKEIQSKVLISFLTTGHLPMNRINCRM